jgi:hypothetical protein
MNWKNWKLICFVAALFAVFGDAAPHLDPMLPDYGPTTSFTLQVSGANTPNVAAHTVTLHPWVTK